MEIAIVGGGIAGLCLALNLKSRGIACRIYERVPNLKELGVGITVLPHAMRELAALGLEDELTSIGIVNEESCFFNRFGQLIYKEPRGRAAGYQHPEVGIHRGKLHAALWRTVVERLGADAVITDRNCVGVEQDEDGATLHFKDSAGTALPPVRADIVVACDGVNSTVRRGFYPGEDVAFTGINTWRGVTRHKPILTGRSYIRVGSILTGKIVIYPIADDIDGDGNQLINWTTEIQQDSVGKNDWNKQGRVEDFIGFYEDWQFDWCDVAALIRNSEQLFEYPMVDKDPVARWTFGRVTLIGDAAHPMYPRGSNGAAQATIDARTLGDLLAGHDDPRDALREYEAVRLPAAYRVVETNRKNPPDFINIKVEELVGDRPFDDLDKYITQDELRALSDSYKAVAGFSLSDVSRKSA